MERQDPRDILSARLGEDAGAAPQQVTATAAQVQAATVAQGRWFLRLLLPLLSRGQRLQLRRALSTGAPAFLRAFAQIVAASPRLQAILQVAPAYAADLAQLHVQLLRILEQSDQL